MKPLPSSLELPEEGSQPSETSSTPFSKDHILVSYQWNEVLDEYLAELSINDYPAHIRNLLTQTVTHEEIRIYSGARVESEGTFIPQNHRSKDHFLGSINPNSLRLVIRSNKRHNIERAVAWIRRLIEQAMNLPKYKEKVLIGLENAAASFDVRGKVLGPSGANLQYITNETGAIVTLRGRGSGFIEPTTGLESIEPLHLCVEHNSKYEVLQAGRQLAFNLIETVQQEWYTFQQQMPHQQIPPPVPPGAAPNSGPPPPQPPPPSHPSQQHHGVVCSGANTLVSVPPPPTTAVPPPLTTSVPPPLLHQPPPPQPTALQLAANLNQLVQGPPPQIQPGQLSQPPPVAAQLIHPGQPMPTQLVQSNQQPGQQNQVPPGQLLQSQHGQQMSQQQQLVQQTQLIQNGQFVSAGSQQPPQILDQNQTVSGQQALSLIHQGQTQSLLQPQQTLSHTMVVPGSGGSVQVLQTPQSAGAGGVQVVQAGHLSALQPHQVSPQTALQEISHVYTATSGGGSGAAASVLAQQVLGPQSGASGGNASVLAQQVLAPQAGASAASNAAAANILAQQVLTPQASIIAQQPHIISQASYPLQYMQAGGGAGAGGMAVLYGTGAGAGAGTRDGVMLVQYGASTARSRLQPQIVQLVHPGTGQVMGTAPLLLQGPSPLLLQQPTAAAGPHPGLLVQQPSSAGVPPSLLLPQHQLQFAQPQPTLQILPQHHPQTMMAVSSSSGVVGHQQGSVSSSGLLSGQCITVSSPPISALRPIQAHKRRFELDPNIQQGIYLSGGSAHSVSQSSNSPQHNKKGIGDEASPSKVAREASRTTSTPPQSQSNSKLILAPSQSDEVDIQQQSRVDMKPDSVKRGRPSNTDELDISKETKQVMYSYGNGKQVLSTTAYQQIPQQPHQPSLQSQLVPSTLQMTPPQGMPPSLQVSAPQQVSTLQQVTVSQGLAPQQQQVASQQFTAPPPHYPPHYYQQPPYQAYQTSWNHMHNSSNQ